MNKQEISQFVLSTRTKQELSQSDLADQIQKRRQAIIEIEKGMVDFRIGTFLAILEALDCELQIIPKTRSGFDFSKIKPAPIDTQIGPFPKAKKKTK